MDSSFQNQMAGVSRAGLVYSITLQGDGMVLIGGFFASFNGVPAASIARLWGDAPLLLESVNRSGADLNLVWSAISNRSYRVQFKADLTATTGQI